MLHSLPLFVRGYFIHMCVQNCIKLRLCYNIGYLSPEDMVVTGPNCRGPLLHSVINMYLEQDKISLFVVDEAHSSRLGLWSINKFHDLGLLFAPQWLFSFVYSLKGKVPLSVGLGITWCIFFSVLLFTKYKHRLELNCEVDIVLFGVVRFSFPWIGATHSFDVYIIRCMWVFTPVQKRRL